MAIILGVLILSPFSASEAEEITLVADQWPPFNCDAAEEEQGYMIDIAREIFSKHGITVIYKNISWNRAVSETKKGDFNGIVGASKTDAEGFIFPDEEMARNTMAFYVNNKSDWTYKDLSSLKTVCLGTVDEYDYRDWLNTYITENRKDHTKVQVMTGEHPLNRNLQKLVGGRIDVIVDNNAAIAYAAKKLGVSDKIKPAWFGGEVSFIYIAFSPALNSSTRYARILSEGIKEIRNTGRLKIIMEKYGLQDWYPQQSN